MGARRGRLGDNTVVIVRAPLLTDSRDNSQYRDWANATRTSIDGCMVEPFPMAEKLNFEDNREREYARSARRFYLPADTDVEYTDRMEFEDKSYDVFGDPGHWYDFDGTKNHKAVIGRVRIG